eukprot:5431036-Amphidinium_carterae.1
MMLAPPQASMAMVGVVRGELDMFESRLQVLSSRAFDSSCGSAAVLAFVVYRGEEQLATLQDGVGKMITRSEKLREAMGQHRIDCSDMQSIDKRAAIPQLHATTVYISKLCCRL